MTSDEWAETPGSDGSGSAGAVGVVKRPNGMEYHPRDLCGLEDVSWLRRCVQDGEHVLLSGPPGTGKTALVEAALAECAGGPGFESFVCTAETTEADLVGGFVQDGDTGRFLWVDGPLVRSVKRGVPFYGDELPLADPGVLSVLYGLMDGRGELIVAANPEMEPVRVVDGWCCVSACNPDAPGVVMSEALLDRFPHCVEVTTDWQLCLDLGVRKDLVEAAMQLDALRAEGQITWSPQMRTLLALNSAERNHGLRYAAAILVQKAPRLDREILVSVLEDFPSLQGAQPAALGGQYRG